MKKVRKLNLEKFNDLSTFEQMRVVIADWKAIKYIENPDWSVQAAACEQNWKAIKYIKNPDREAQVAACQSSWKAIQYIENPCDDVLRICKRQNWYSDLYQPVNDEK